MIEATTQEGFIKAYWIQYKDKGVSPEDFFAFYSALESILAEDGIHVVDDGTQRVSDLEVEEELPSLARVILWERPDVVLRHDVKHRLLIEQLRGSGNLTFANARYWFLTQDSALPRYAEIPREGQAEVAVPFCAATSAWAQVVRSLVPRTEDLDQVLVDLLASPYMRYRGAIPAQIVQEVVARIDQYEGVSPELASEVLLNGALIREISSTRDPQERTNKIDNALIKSAEALQVRVETLTEREAQQREAARQAEAEASSSQAEVSAAHERIRALEAELAERRAKEHQLSDRLSDAAAETRAAEARAEEQSRLEREERASLDARLAATEKQLADQASGRANRARQRRWVVAVGLWVLAVLASTLLLALGVVTTVWPIVGVFGGALLVVCLGVGLVFGHRTAWRVLVVCGVLIGVVAGIQQLVSAASDGENSPNPSSKQ
jgi:VIT1/CCC1 family predicted Fe2+/Mn2+ transporter